MTREYHLEVAPHVMTTAADGGSALVLAVEAAVLMQLGSHATIEWRALVQPGQGRMSMPRWRFGERIPDHAEMLICYGRASP